MDDNGDEIDGYDESLVPYDAPMNYQKGVYEGENHLIDDEFGVLLSELREKVGPAGNVLTIIDACYSGTITRGKHSNRIRGTHIKMAPEDYNPAVTGKEEAGVVRDACGC